MLRISILSKFIPILILSFIPISIASSGYAELRSGANADVVVGQPDFTQGTANNGGQGANTLSGIRHVFSDGQRLFGTDTNNQRVLIWNSVPTSNFAAADIVLGQPDFNQSTADNGGQGANTINNPIGISSDGKRLFVADAGNHRILIYNSIPTTHFASADVVVGQPDFTQDTADNGGQSANTLNFPFAVSQDGKRLYVADQFNNRVLIWNSIPTSNFTPADVVLGQPDFAQDTANNGGRGANTLNAPVGAFSDGKKLFVTELSNHRVLIWNSIPTSNATPADVVLGQPDFTQGTSNNTGCGARTLSGPRQSFSDGQKLFVADAGNHRILIWNSIPTTDFAAADIVIGQPDFSQGTLNNGGRGANTLSLPFGVSSDGKRLFVSELTNNRILIFDIGALASRRLTPQFSQGKGVLGKVFWDLNENGVQDEGENGIAGIKVASDTGIYAITDEDGKYHYPYIETGQRILKVDPSTLEEGSVLTTDNPRKVTVTEGILTKVSFGVSPVMTSSSGSDSVTETDSGPLLKVSMSQDPLELKKNLSVTHSWKDDATIDFRITCNYRLFVSSAELLLYDQAQSLIKTVTLPHPVPYGYVLDFKQIGIDRDRVYYYQLKIHDTESHADSTELTGLS